MSPQSYELLLAMYERPNQLLTRQELGTPFEQHDLVAEFGQPQRGDATAITRTDDHRVEVEAAGPAPTRRPPIDQWKRDRLRHRQRSAKVPALA